MSRSSLGSELNFAPIPMFPSSSEDGQVDALMPGNPIIPVRTTKQLINCSSSSVFQIEAELIATGFLCTLVVARGKALHGFVTNNHIIARRQFNKSIRLLFEFGAQYMLQVSDMPYAFTDQDLDATFVQLTPSFISNLTAKGATFLSVSHGSQFFTGRFYIIQYPLGGKVCISAGDISQVPDGFMLRHQASTQDGSSGSPLVDENLRVIAIHRGTRGGKYNLATVMQNVADAVSLDYNKSHRGVP